MLWWSSCISHYLSIDLQLVNDGDKIESNCKLLYCDPSVFALSNRLQTTRRRVSAAVDVPRTVSLDLVVRQEEERRQRIG